MHKRNEHELQTFSDILNCNHMSILKYACGFIYFHFVLMMVCTAIDSKILKYCASNTEKGLSGLAALRW